MKTLFEVIILEEAFDFLKELDRKHYEKILYNIRKAQVGRDPELFKKITDQIWEFRTLYSGIQYRMLAFWDKCSSENTLVIATNAFIKKRSQIPEKEIERAMNIRQKYFEEKNEK